MKRVLSLTAPLAISLIALGCGSSRQLQSVSISPAAADAQNFTNGKVQFTATGTFNQKPSPEKLMGQTVQWCVGSANGKCPGNINPGASVDQNGLAQCSPNFTGTVNVLAGNGGSSMMPDGGSQMKVFGAAQLTCP